jgi:hypothetical protein
MLTGADPSCGSFAEWPVRRAGKHKTLYVIARGGISPVARPAPARDAPSSPALSHDTQGRSARSRKQISTILQVDQHHPGDSRMNLGQAN